MEVRVENAQTVSERHFYARITSGHFHVGRGLENRVKNGVMLFLWSTFFHVKVTNTEKTYSVNQLV